MQELKLIALESLKGCAIIRPHGREEIALIKKFSERLNHFEIPTVEAEPVRHGHWNATGKTNIWQCSECNGLSEGTKRFCGDCGARMDGMTNFRYRGGAKNEK